MHWRVLVGTEGTGGTVGYQRVLWRTCGYWGYWAVLGGTWRNWGVKGGTVGYCGILWGTAV